MILGSIARRYAKALFSLAVEKNRVDAWADGLVALGQAVDRSPELRDVLQNPAYTREDRAAVVAKLAAATQLDAEPAALLNLLGDRNRLAGLSAVIGDAAIQAIAEKLSAATQKKVLVERAVDPAILGGVVAQVGSVVYDGSLRAQLEDLRSTLKR
jgi:F-type H+-transporting ATPase subunit delta